MPQLLSGIRVLDLGRVLAAPICTQMLGDLGAEVIKVERPGRGDEARYVGRPSLRGPDGRERAGEAATYLSANRNKRSITIDLAHPAGADLLRRLATKSEVLVENFKAGDLARYKLDYASVRALRPEIIYCSITGFGQSGPYAERPGMDSVFQALSGMMSITGEPDGQPQKVGVQIIDYITGIQAAFAIVAALRHREVNGGPGQHIDLALLDCALASLTLRAQHHLISGEDQPRAGNRTPGAVPVGAYRCRDGDVMLSAGNDQNFRRVCEALGRPELAADPRFVGREDRVKNEAALEEILAQAFASNTVAYWIERLDRAEVIAAPIKTIAQSFQDEQIRHRGMRVDVDHPAGMKLPLVANPIRFSETPLERYEAPPVLGADTDAVLRGVLQLDDAQLRELRADGVFGTK
jgi:crotonobetainyl-CoA:carnitine CoA-transferase CaiB-like acyl-CoA transferase